MILSVTELTKYAPAPVKISFIVTVYNTNPKLFQKCLESMLNQTFPGEGYEVIIVDDCSTAPETIGLIRQAENRFPNLVRVVYLPNNCGTPSVGRNIGILIAGGEYIYIGDSDDYFSEKALELAYAVLNEQKLDALIVPFLNAGSERDINEENRDAKPSFSIYKDGTYIPQLFVFREIVRRELILKNQIFFDENLAFCEDMLWSTKVNLYGKRFGEFFGVKFYHRITDDNIDDNGAYASHLGKQRKNSAFTVTIKIKDMIVNANVPNERKALFLQSCWGVGDLFIQNKASLQKELAVRNAEKLFADMKKTISGIPDEILGFFSHENLKIMNAVKSGSIENFLNLLD